MKKLVLSVGIPAYNEEKNIKLLLKSLIAQNALNLQIKNIFVVSDRSTDNTTGIVQEMHKQDRRITLVENKKRIGKSGSVKKLFSLAKKTNSEVIVILDADLQVKNKNVLSNLCNPFLENENLFVACGTTLPHKPTNFIQKLGNLGVEVMNKAIRDKKNISGYYLSTDQLVALRVKFLNQNYLKRFKFTHDEFFFLLAQKYKKDFISVKNATAYYLLPSSLSDYYKQMLRFLSSGKISSSNFSEETIEKYATLSTKDKLTAFLSLFVKQPLTASIYIVLQTSIHFIRKMNTISDNPVWESVKSTK